jgi:hypothetical protein
MTSFQVKVLQKKFTLLHADFSKIVLKYSNEVHLLCYLTPLYNTFSVFSIVHKFGHTFQNLFTAPVSLQSVQCPHVHLKSIHMLNKTC